MKKFMSYAVRPGTGRTVPQAQVVVRAHPSIPEGPPAPIFSDYDGLVPLAQPFLTDEVGLIKFYAPDGRYDIYITPPYDGPTALLDDTFIYDPSSVSEVSNALSSSYFVTYAPDSLLPNEICIPTLRGHPDSPPATPHQYDNEFDTFGADWLPFNSDDNTTLETIDGRLHLKQETTQVTNPVVGAFRNFTPDADFSLTALIRFGYHAGLSGVEMSGERPMWSLGLRTSLGEIRSIGLRAGSQGISVFRSDYNTTGLVATDGYQQLGSNSCYVRIRRKSSNLLFEWSQDGFSWVTVQEIAEASVYSGTLVQFGLYGYASFASGGNIDCYADFIRYKAG